ncbi:MAG: amidohydrolase family protein [Defluviitaleaceae bacterium]|nr:amidohydrolase family protein [Defluviitaleaceae bacterium]
MKIIDAHTHFSNIAAFHYAAEESGVDFSYNGLLNEQAENNIVASVCMGLVETRPGVFPDRDAPGFMWAHSPGELNAGGGVGERSSPLHGIHEDCPSNMYVCMGVNPHTLSNESVVAMDKFLKTDRVKARIVGFKIYAGYYHFNINDPVYTPVYKLAAEYGLTVAIHTGDTYAETALLEYSHPLAADRLAVTFRDVNFMLCHMGDPWIMDACEVAYKNRNIFLDISGLQAGDAAHIAATEGRAVVMHHYTQGLAYLNQFDKVLFGTDWPLVPLGAYIEFCKKLVPAETYDDVFYNNAVKLFNIKEA